MQRRTFLQAAALLGLSVMVPRAAREARAGGPTYAGPFWVFVHAPGGWDPTYLCDPKGGTPGDPTTPNQLYTPADIQKAGNIAYAPVHAMADATTELYSCQRFFEAHHGRLCVVNGMDAQSISHDGGPRGAWSGQVAEGYPAFAALVAAEASRQKALPLAFQSNGGYDATWDLVPVTRLAGSMLRQIAYPNRTDPTNATAVFHTASTAQSIADLQRQRLQKMQAAQHLPYTRRSMGSLVLARTGDDALPLLAAQLDATKPVSLFDAPDLANVAAQERYKLDDLQVMLEQIQLAVLGFKAGVTVSANLVVGAFDTHHDHDDNHVPAMMKLLRGVDYLLAAADAAGILDRLYVVIGSDFGRPPFYNDAHGKDHWDVTSMLFMGPGIAGDRVVGATDDGLRGLAVDPGSLALDPKGVRITPQHVHRALRKLAGIQNSASAAPYPLVAEDLPLFGA